MSKHLPRFLRAHPILMVAAMLALLAPSMALMLMWSGAAKTSAATMVAFQAGQPPAAEVASAPSVVIDGDGVVSLDVTTAGSSATGDFDGQGTSSLVVVTPDIIATSTLPSPVAIGDTTGKFTVDGASGLTAAAFTFTPTKTASAVAGMGSAIVGQGTFQSTDLQMPYSGLPAVQVTSDAAIVSTSGGVIGSASPTSDVVSGEQGGLWTLTLRLVVLAFAASAALAWMISWTSAHAGPLLSFGGAGDDSDTRTAANGAFDRIRGDHRLGGLFGQKFRGFLYRRLAGLTDPSDPRPTWTSATASPPVDECATGSVVDGGQGTHGTERKEETPRVTPHSG